MYSGITREREIDITQEQFDNYEKNGMLIHRAMPNLSASDREFIMTGMTDAEWDANCRKIEEIYETNGEEENDDKAF